MSEHPESRTHTSLNAIKHGCRSRALLLPHEDPNAWMQLREKYVAEFDPQSAWMEELMEDAVQAHWILTRNQVNLHITLVDLPPDPRLWNAEDHHQIALFTRYQTTAERTFHRALARLRSFHKDQLAARPLPEHESGARIQQKTEARIQHRSGAPIEQESEAPNPMQPSKPKLKPEPIVIEQWVEVRRIDNRPVTQFTPSNDELEELLATAKPTPQLVYRRIFFPEGVPSQYQWTKPRNSNIANGGLAIQRMTVETWRKLREIERETGHAASTGQPSLPDWRDEQP